MRRPSVAERRPSVMERRASRASRASGAAPSPKPMPEPTTQIRSLRGTSHAATAPSP